VLAGRVQGQAQQVRRAIAALPQMVLRMDTEARARLALAITLSSIQHGIVPAFNITKMPGLGTVMSCPLRRRRLAETTATSPGKGRSVEVASMGALTGQASTGWARVYWMAATLTRTVGA
jgi:hypothetical protein